MMSPNYAMGVMIHCSNEAHPNQFCTGRCCGVVVTARKQQYFGSTVVRVHVRNNYTLPWQYGRNNSTMLPWQYGRQRKKQLYNATLAVWLSE